MGTVARWLLPVVLAGLFAETLLAQTIRGRVVDRDTGQPLPGAHVVMLHTDPLRGTTTDGEGWFVLGGLAPGRYDLRISFLGYEPVVLSGVLVSAGQETVLEIALKEQVITGAAVVVTPAVEPARPLNDFALLSARSFSVEETRRYAGGLDDPARMAAVFAGITSGAGIQDNALIIRGNAPKGVQWRLEGVEIPNPNHFADQAVLGGGGLTLFSSQLLADSDVLTGAFPAEYGNVLAGVFDMRFRRGNAARRSYAFQLGLIGIDLSSEGPFVQGRASSYLFNYRYSTLALLLPLLPTDDVARFQDLSFKLSFPLGRRGWLDVWGIGGLDRQTFTPEADTADWQYRRDRVRGRLALDIGAMGLSLRQLLGDRTLWHTTLALTLHHTHLDERLKGWDGVLRDDLTVRSTEDRLIVRSYIQHKFGARHTAQVGVVAQWPGYDLHLRAAPHEGQPLETIASGAGRSQLLQAYAQSLLRPSARLTVNVGLHLMHVALTRHTLLEPRMGVRWTVADGHVLHAGYGLHSQIEPLRIYFVTRTEAGQQVQPNRRLGPARAHHLVADYERHLSTHTRLRLEGYVQELFEVPVVPGSPISTLNLEQDWAFQETLVNEGAGRNTGIELTLERFFSQGSYYLITASLFRARYRGGDGRWRPTRWDRGYTINALWGREWTLGRNLLGLNLRGSLLGGRRWSPVDPIASAQQQDVVEDLRRAFAEREPDLWLVDLTITYRRNHRRHAEVWALQIKNLLGARETYRAYNMRTGRVEAVREGFPLPVLSFKLLL